MHFTMVTEPVRLVYKLDVELDEFMKTGWPMAQSHYDPPRYKNPYIAARSINRGAKHWGYPIHAFVREGKLYLIRTDM